VERDIEREKESSLKRKDSSLPGTDQRKKNTFLEMGLRLEGFLQKGNAAPTFEKSLPARVEKQACNFSRKGELRKKGGGCFLGDVKMKKGRGKASF